jgi:hypothetical protein
LKVSKGNISKVGLKYKGRRTDALSNLSGIMTASSTTRRAMKSWALLLMDFVGGGVGHKQIFCSFRIGIGVIATEGRALRVLLELQPCFITVVTSDNLKGKGMMWSHSN